jgi:N-methylhydantoinase B
MDRVRCKPWGLFGGLSGAGNSVALYRFGSEKEVHFPNGKAFNQTIKPGDAYVLRSGGGGGFGSPLERDIEKLQRDVRCGYVTRHAAIDLYGAVFIGDTDDLDAAATKARRVKMKEQGLPVDEPISESPVPVPQPDDHGHHGHHRHLLGLDKLTDEERVVLAMSSRCCS